MKNFSYTKTPELIDKLEEVENLRKSILMHNISPFDELLLRHDKTLETVDLFIYLQGGIDPNTHDKMNITYKNKLSAIYSHWTASTSPITSAAIDSIYIDTTNQLPLATSKSILLQQLLKYSQASMDHPILQAGLIHGMILAEEIFSNHTQLMAYITQLLFLYKNGYGLRGMTSDTKYIIDNAPRYHDLISRMSNDANMTPWLEFVIDSSLMSLTTTYEAMSNSNTKKQKNELNLNERQKQIMLELSSPNSKLSNKTVQRKYKVSPITASRDLKKLVDFGIVMPMGRGRSTYYTLV